MFPEQKKICPKCHKIVFKGHDDSENCACDEESYMEIISISSDKEKKVEENS